AWWKPRDFMPRAAPQATSAKRWNRRRRSAASASRTTSPGSPCSTPPTTRVGSPARRSSWPAASGNSTPEPVSFGLESPLEKTDEHDHSERRHRDLLQGLGQRPADRFLARLASFGRRLGRAND